MPGGQTESLLRALFISSVYTLSIRYRAQLLHHPYATCNGNFERKKKNTTVTGLSTFIEGNVLACLIS